MLILSLPISPPLQQWIESIVYLEGDSVHYSLPMVPRNFSALFFVAEEEGVLNFTLNGGDNILERGGVYLAGLGNIPSSFEIKGDFKLLTVIFKPYATGAFFGDRADLLTNAILPIFQFSSKLRDLNQQIWETKLQLKEKAECIECFLYLHLNQSKLPSSVVRAYNEIILHGGSLEIKEVASRSFTGSRNLLRHFGEYIGISPKQYSSALRFNSFLKGYKSLTSSDLYHCLLDYGYYDYSHLKRDFLRFMGEGSWMNLTDDHEINRLIM